MAAQLSAHAAIPPLRWGLVLAASMVWRGSPGPGNVAATLTEDEDQLVLAGATSAAAPALVVHGSKSGDECPDEVALTGDGPHFIANVVPPSACEVAVFAKKHAVVEVAPPWTTGPDIVPLQVGGNPVEVELDVYIATTDTRAAKWARGDLTRARTVYGNNRVGITFHEAKFVTASSLSPAEVALIGDDCNNVDMLKSSTLYDASRMNVYYVHAIGGSTARGWNCFSRVAGNSAGASNVIYISTSSHSPTTLAHELGHSFALQGATGHTGQQNVEPPDIAGFTSINIMWTYLDSDQARAQRQFSLGQAYRMNADDISWVHLSKGGVSSGGLQARHCHPSGPLNRTPCPALAFDVPQGEDQ